MSEASEILSGELQLRFRYMYIMCDRFFLHLQLFASIRNFIDNLAITFGLEKQTSLEANQHVYLSIP